MDPLTTLGPIALQEIFHRTLSRILEEVGASSKSWFRKSRLADGLTSYEKFLVRSVSTIPLFASNRDIPVESLYVSLRLSPDLEREKYKSPDQIHAMIKRQRSGLTSTEHRSVAAKTPLEVINSSSAHLAILGPAGSGKTTASRYLAFLMAKGEEVRGSQRIPFYIPVRDLGGKSLLQAAERALGSLGIEDSKRIIADLMKSGRLVLLLDGLDETSEEHQRTLLAELQELDARYPKTILVASARPHALSIGLPNFAKWETLPLEFPERLRFVERWFREADPSKGESLIARCSRRPEMLDLGSSPLLLSIVCALYHNDLDLPMFEEDLFARAAEGLLGGWDAFRNIARRTPLSVLSVNKRVIFVSNIAANLFSRGKVVFSPQDLEETGCLKREAGHLHMDPLDESIVLTSLYNDFGIILERAPNLYSFSHLTLHEYFVARYIVDNRRELALLYHHRRDPSWLEVIRLVARMLPRIYGFKFIEQLMDLTATHDEYSVELLRTIWFSGPLPARSETNRILRKLIERVKTDVESFPGSLFKKESDKNTLCIEQEPGSYWGLGSCLPKIIDLVSRSGFDREGLDTMVRRFDCSFELLDPSLRTEFTGGNIYPII